MKVLLLNGSPKEKGCTYTALAEVAKTLNEENFSGGKRYPALQRLQSLRKNRKMRY